MSSFFCNMYALLFHEDSPTLFRTSLPFHNAVSDLLSIRHRHEREQIFQHRLAISFPFRPVRGIIEGLVRGIYGLAPASGWPVGVVLYPQGHILILKYG